MTFWIEPLIARVQAEFSSLEVYSVVASKICDVLAVCKLELDLVMH
jgi:hypothetical protein